MSKIDDYLAVAALMSELDGEVIDSQDMVMYAMSYAMKGWRVFPLGLRSKTPAIGQVHTSGDPLKGKCTGECGKLGHGFHDATTDLEQIIMWWAVEYRGAGIGWVPDWDTTLVLDLDRHHKGQDGVERFRSLVGTMESVDTMTIRSGGGGLHLFYQRPEGRISVKGLQDKFGLGHGIDLRGNGYLVAPPTIHPETLKPYVGVIAPMTEMPYAVRRYVVESRRSELAQQAAARTSVSSGSSVADWFTGMSSWNDILEPHGWELISGDGDEHGSLWRHPTATAPHSALVDEYGNLHVFSPNTPLDASRGRSGGTGYTRFRAYAVLNHSGDMTSAALELLELKHGLEDGD